MSNHHDISRPESPEFGLYIHVPYCRVACPYCDFVKKPTPGHAPAPFVQALCNEISRFEGPSRATSVFFGGGTPSLLAPGDFTRVMNTLAQRFQLVNPEISIEVNPDDVTPETCALWKDAGVNRLNVGVQSFDPDVLHFLGRNHNARMARRACELAAEAFHVWGVDLIFGARPARAWNDTLAQTLALHPPHVSTYGLTYEENTPFWKQRHDAIDDDESLELYRAAIDALVQYNHYEVSNFARPGFECRHNKIYWRNDDYAGFGPGAYSYLEGVRARNLPHINRYIAAPGEKAEALALTPIEIRVETLIQHFRTREGISSAYYHHRFHTHLEDDFGPALQRLAARGLITRDTQACRPTQAGYEMNNEIGLEIVESLAIPKA